jgi:hypothetical protein
VQRPSQRIDVRQRRARRGDDADSARRHAALSPGPNGIANSGV